MMDSKILSSIKIEQPEVDLEYPGVHSATKETVDEGHTFCETDKEIPAVVKIEKSGVYLEYPDFKPVKQELPAELCEDKTHRFGKMIDMASSRIFPYMVGNSNTDPTITESDYKVLFDLENCSRVSKNVSSVTEINKSRFLTNNNFEFHDLETVVNHEKIPRGSLDFTIDSANITHPETQTRYSLNEYDPNISEEKASQKVEKPDEEQVCDDENEEKLHYWDNYITSFIQNANVYVHKKIHTLEKRYKCDICGTSFAQSYRLKRHKRTHTGEKPYKCDVCGATFSQNYYLKDHKRTHTGEKPYKCNICETSFSLSGSLQQHKRTHTGEKPYKCDVCEASFNQTSALKQHKRIHTGEKPYECDVCEASFNRANVLKRHKKIHTGDKPYK